MHAIWQFLITFITESNHKGGRGGGGQKTPNLDYVIHRCSLKSLIIVTTMSLATRTLNGFNLTVQYLLSTTLKATTDCSFYSLASNPHLCKKKGAAPNILYRASYPFFSYIVHIHTIQYRIQQYTYCMYLLLSSKSMYVSPAVRNFQYFCLF